MLEHRWIKILFTPFSLLYGLITILRNKLYELRILSVKRPPVFSVSVGNLTVGGTGKTPMIEHLVRTLSPTSKIAVLSRGYGRKSKGLVFADDHSSAEDIGDEPLQYYQKYGGKLVIAVCESRVTGAEAIHEKFPERNLLLLDDAFQHRSISPDVQILLSDYNRPFYEDQPFPGGRLRETRSGARRADAIVVTKCPSELPETEKERIKQNIHAYSNPVAPVFFSTVSYDKPLGFDLSPVSLNKVKVVAGIASPEPFIAFLRSKYEIVDEIIYPDHHNYTAGDMERLIQNLKNDTFVLTTEKDMVKLKPLAAESGRLNKFAFIPITVDFGSDASKFDQWLMQRIPAEFH